MSVVPDTMKDYMLAWFQTVTQNEFVPGMYCHVRNAQELKAVALQGYPADRPQPLFWVAGGAHPFNPATSAPADSGIALPRCGRAGWIQKTVTEALSSI